MFATLPSGFPKLQAAVLRMDTVGVTKPPPIDAIGKRLRKSYALARTRDYGGLSFGEIRKLPYAYWLPPERPLSEIDGPLVSRYWSESLLNALSSGPRRTKRWLNPLFFTYCEFFNAEDEAFLEFADRLVKVLHRGEGAFADRLHKLHRDVAFFIPALAPRRLAETLLNHPHRLDEAFEAYLLWPQFVDTLLGKAAFAAALSLGEARLSDWAVIARLLDWERRFGARVAQTQHRVRFADALLTPWARRAPPDRVKSALVEFFVRVYGDPRMEGNREFRWKGVSPRAMAVLMNWLAGDTLRGFMKVLERTADDIWTYRQKFWMAYYDSGHIQEAWLALGAQALGFARRLKADQHGLGYGRLDGGAAPNQSVLLLKMGSVVFTEWSHNGSLRAYEEGEDDTPALYETSYHGADLRAAVSLDFHDGENQNPELRHMNSAGGTWQRKARDFINEHTGVLLEDRKII